MPLGFSRSIFSKQPADGAYTPPNYADSDWRTFATTFSSRAEPSDPFGISRDHTLFNCGYDSYWYVYAGTESGNDHYIYKFTRSGNSISYTNKTQISDSAGDLPFNVGFTFISALSLRDNNAALVVNGSNYVMLSSDASGNLTVENDGTITNGRQYGQQCLNPDDNTQHVVCDESGNFTFCTINYGTYTLTQDSTGSTGKSATDGQAFIIDDNGTARFAYAFYSNTDSKWAVYACDFDGSNGAVTLLNSTPSGLNTDGWKRVEDKVSNGVVYTMENNGTTGTAFSIYWDYSTFNQGADFTYTPGFPTGTNNIRTTGPSHFLQQDNDYMFFGTHIHDAVNSAGGTPRTDETCVFQVAKSDGTITQKGSMMQKTDVASTAGNVRLGTVVSNDESFYVASGDSDGSGISDGVPELILVYT